MKGFPYLKELSLEARWFLPHQKAVDLIEDYQELLKELGEEEVRKRFGSPKKLVREFSQPFQRRRWHIVLGLLLFCSLIPILYSLIHFYAVFDSHFAMDILAAGFVLWASLEILWERRNSWSSRNIFPPKPVSLLLEAVPWLLALLVLFLRPAEGGWWIYDVELYLLIAGVLSLGYFGFSKLGAMPNSLVAAFVGAFLVTGGIYSFFCYLCFTKLELLVAHTAEMYYIFYALLVLLMLAALVSLFLARMRDRRWRGVFLMTLLGVLLCFSLSRTAYWVDEGQVPQVLPLLNLFRAFSVPGFLMALAGLV